MPTPNFRGRNHTCHTHAVTSAGDCDYIYDSSGSIVRRDRNSQAEFRVEWNSFNKPTILSNATQCSEFEYDVDGRRTRQLIFESSSTNKKVYATSAYEIKETLTNPAETNRANWQWEMDYVRIHVDTPVGRIGIYRQEGNTNGVGSVTRSYIHKDHLGSVVAVSGDAATPNVTHYSFGAWGNRRDPSDWSPYAPSSLPQAPLSTDRGYTGHEQLDHLDLVHMNGRIYDPVIGRMISADPLIQAPENLQSFNRYSYVFNNPLTHTDPSGFATKKAVKSAVEGAKNLGETLGAVALSVLDNIGGSIVDASKQVDDYFTDGSGNTQVDQTSQTDSHLIGASGNENIPQAGNVTDANYGLGTGSEAANQGGFFNSDTYGYASEWKTGLAEGAYEGLRALGHLIAHPVKTVKGIPEGIKQGWKNTKKFWGDVWNGTGDPDATARTLGKWTFNAEAAVVTGAGVKTLKANLSKWPANRGFANPPNQAVLQAGSVVDRYGGSGGKFVAPQGTAFGTRSLPANFVNKPLNTYKVLKPINVDAGIATPWFKQPGLGVQFELPSTVNQLIESGHLGPAGN